ncbi:MAG: hypothetical protein WCD70_09765 [Alphaproteobacteria bacterium]
MPDADRLPPSNEWLASRGWKLASGEAMRVCGVSPDKCERELHKPNDWYQNIATGQLAYQKFISPVKAFSECLASYFALSVGLCCPRIEVNAYRDPLGRSAYACASPLLGTQPRNLFDFIEKELPGIAPENPPPSIAQISRSVSSFIPFWICTANTDASTENFVIVALNGGSVGGTSIDHTYLGFHPANYAEISLAHIFRASRPFYIDTQAMEASANAIAALPQTNLRQIVEQAFDKCQISSNGIEGSCTNDSLPALHQIYNVLLKRQETLHTQIHTPSYMSKVMNDDYDCLNKRTGPGTPTFHPLTPAGAGFAP